MSNVQFDEDPYASTIPTYKVQNRESPILVRTLLKIGIIKDPAQGTLALIILGAVCVIFSIVVIMYAKSDTTELTPEQKRSIELLQKVQDRTKK